MKANTRADLIDLACQLRAASAEVAETVQFLQGMRVGMQVTHAAFEVGLMADALNKALQAQSRLVGSAAALQTMSERG